MNESQITNHKSQIRDHRSDISLLFYSPRFYPLLGGLERVVEAWATELTKSGVSVCVVTSTATEVEDAFVFPVYRRLSFFKLVKLMRGVNAVIQFNVALNGLPAWWLSRKPLIISHHTLLVETGERGRWQQRLKRRVSNRFAVSNICCSRYIASQFRQTVVIHSPYQSAIFTNRQQNRQAGSLVFAGRLVTDKGIDLLLKALATLEPSLYCGLAIVGDGSEKKVLMQLSRDLGLADKAVFCGKLEAAELAKILNESQLMIVPSVVEPFGITVLEGLASGCGMVVSDTGGLPEAAGGFAEMFTSGDVHSLAAAIRRALKESPAVDEAAVCAHLQKMTVEYTGRRFLEVVRECLG